MINKYPFWPFYSGLGFAIFGVLLIVLKSGIKLSFIFFIIALFLWIIWTYIIIRVSIKNKKNENKICECTICGHKQSDVCVKERCPCCINMKNNIVSGHSNSFYGKI
ncbi:MAG TPA: hypothetical protein VIY08_08275 [Candidatus Nitrosocosmicus sp.]